MKAITAKNKSFCREGELALSMMMKMKLKWTEVSTIFSTVLVFRSPYSKSQPFAWSFFILIYFQNSPCVMASSEYVSLKFNTATTKELLAALSSFSEGEEITSEQIPPLKVSTKEWWQTLKDELDENTQQSLPPQNDSPSSSHSTKDWWEQLKDDLNQQSQSTSTSPSPSSKDWWESMKQDLNQETQNTPQEPSPSHPDSSPANVDSSSTEEHKDKDKGNRFSRLFSRPRSSTATASIQRDLQKEKEKEKEKEKKKGDKKRKKKKEVKFQFRNGVWDKG